MKGNLLSFILHTIRNSRLIHLHWMGLDMAAAAMISQLAISRIPLGKAAISYPVTIILGLGVFILSNLNRLLDNRKPAKTETKRFLANQKERIYFLKIIAVALVFAAGTAFSLPGNLWKLALGLTVFSGLALWLTSRLPDKSPLQILREPFYAVILTAAILGNTYLNTPDPEIEIKYISVLFFLTVFQNFLLASYFDAVEYPGTCNMATILKAPLAKQMLHCITLIVLAGCIVVCLKTEFRYPQRLSIILLSMSVLQSLILHKTKFLNQTIYKGVLITLVLILPFLVL
ncbi:hypothetical protein [Dyadobacter sp. LHD-138]|uniref:hypothetical protein n=1 Tax=Dyadobacter sp. LHD-138 TaxID=3071413 RepID=UPI0027E0D976|nr:hypothetical protein [Dyadobacter sp. LHD-138]MDQ6479537.1 hypothetical protein [Dyadobacter sp. LHD-138]